jgi:hypothetical protein
MAYATKSHGTDPDRHGNEEGAHANQRDDILNQIGHNSLLLLICSQFVLILFQCQRTSSGLPDESGLPVWAGLRKG